METVSRASFTGGRRGTGVTSGPMRMRLVASAMAASATHGSTVGAGINCTWSQMKNPSQPTSSASRAIPASRRGSKKSPKLGTVRP